MAVRPIIEIAVDDSAFKRFYDLFQQYSDQLADMPETWRALDEAMGSSGDALKGGALDAKEALVLAATQASYIAEALKGATKEQQGLARATHTSNKAMQALAKSSAAVGSAVEFVGGWILKLGAFAGLGAVLSGFGIGDLASAAFSRYRAAGAIGVSPGALASLQVHGAPFGLNEGSLRSAAAQQLNISNAGWWSVLGLNAQRSMSESPLALLFQETRAAAVGYRAHPQAFYNTPAGIAAQQLGLDMGTIRLAARDLAGFDAAVQATTSDIGALNFTAKVGKKWTELQVAFSSASMKIETSLINLFYPLATPIAGLVHDFTGLVTDLTNSPFPRWAVDELGKGIKDLADWLSPQNAHKIEQDITDFFTKTDWKTIGQDVLLFGLELSALVNNPVARRLLGISSTPSQKAEYAYLETARSLAWYNSPAARIYRAFGGTGGPSYSQLQSANYDAFSRALLADIGAPSTAANIAYLDRWQRQEGTSAAYNPLATTQPEPNATNFNSFGPGGIYHVRNYQTALQGLRATVQTLRHYRAIMNALKSGNPWARSGVARDLSTWGTGNRWYSAISQSLAGRFRGSVGNFGLLNTVDAALDKYGSSWIRHLPRDVARIVNAAHLTPEERSPSFSHFMADRTAINRALKAFLAHRPAHPGVHVSISRPTDARVAVSVNAIAVT